MLGMAIMGICLGLGLGVRVPTSVRGPLFDVKADVNSPSGKSLGTPRLRVHAFEEGTVCWLEVDGSVNHRTYPKWWLGYSRPRRAPVDRRRRDFVARRHTRLEVF
jgi:hypothetical protein